MRFEVTPRYKVALRLLARMYTQGCFISVDSGFRRNDGYTHGVNRKQRQICGKLGQIERPATYIYVLIPLQNPRF